MKNLVCWNCGNNLEDVLVPIARQAACSNCFYELHCCRLCRHYDEEKTVHCFEDRADPPLQKENANFCEFYAPQAGAFDTKTARNGAPAMNALDTLFGAEQDQESDAANSETDTLDSARKRLDDLFK